MALMFQVRWPFLGHKAGDLIPAADVPESFRSFNFGVQVNLDDVVDAVEAVKEAVAPKAPKQKALPPAEKNISSPVDSPESATLQDINKSVESAIEDTN